VREVDCSWGGAIGIPAFINFYGRARIVRTRQIHEDLRLLLSSDEESRDTENATCLYYEQTSYPSRKAGSCEMAFAQSAGTTFCPFAKPDETLPHDMADTCDLVTAAVVRSDGGQTVNGASSFSSEGA